MKINFVKMTGAGNDFIMLDNRDGTFSNVLNTQLIEKLCKRAISVGADGLITIENSKTSAFNMKYYNSDGSRASMCGNGARCICQYACFLGIIEAGQEFSFTSDAGTHTGLVTSTNEARIWLTDPELFFLNKSITLQNVVKVNFADTGVPQVVVFTEDLNDGTFEEQSHLLRSHPEFGENGANVNWVKILPDGSLVMRTFERGVEAETLACGTGAVASALISLELYDSVKLPVAIKVKSGLTLKVGKDLKGWWLQGHALLVYTGEIQL